MPFPSHWDGWIFVRMWQNLNLYTLMMVMYNGALTLENRLAIFRKLKLLCDPAIPRLGIFIQDGWKHTSAQKCAPLFAAVLSWPQDVETAQMAINWGVDRHNAAQPHRAAAFVGEGKGSAGMCQNMDQLGKPSASPKRLPDSLQEDARHGQIQIQKAD